MFHGFFYLSQSMFPHCPLHGSIKKIDGILPLLMNRVFPLLYTRIQPEIASAVNVKLRSFIFRRSCFFFFFSRRGWKTVQLSFYFNAYIIKKNLHNSLYMYEHTSTYKYNSEITKLINSTLSHLYVWCCFTFPSGYIYQAKNFLIMEYFYK